MASSLARFRHNRKKLNLEELQLTYQSKYPLVPGHGFQVFTKELYFAAFPEVIPQGHLSDEKDGDYTYFLKYHKPLGSGRFGKASVMVRKDFIHYACNKVVRNSQKQLVALFRMDAKRVDYLDAIRMAEPFMMTFPGVSPFLTKVLMAFRSMLPTAKEYYYLVCQYFQSGSSLCNELRKRCRFTEAEARLYFMEAADALMCVHSNGKMLRRFSLCNLLLNYYSHIRVSPYTWCDQNLDCGQPSNMLVMNCGDQFYASPEVVFGVEILPVADWWSMGVILYHMLTGTLPFTGKTLVELGKSITEDEVEFPENLLSPEATTLIRNLLHKDPLRRLGCGPNGLSDIMKHPFFAGLDWGDVRHGIQPLIKLHIDGDQYHCQRGHEVKREPGSNHQRNRPRQEERYKRDLLCHWQEKMKLADAQKLNK